MRFNWEYWEYGKQLSTSLTTGNEEWPTDTEEFVGSVMAM